MTDPQNDKPCRDCKRPTQHDTERCDDCRTPAGRLVTALAVLGIKATTSRGNIRVAGHTFVCEPGDEGEPWTISDVAGTLDEATEAAADAIAAIANRDAHAHLAAEVKRLREELEKPVAGAWSESSVAGHWGRAGGVAGAHPAGWFAYTPDGCLSEARPLPVRNEAGVDANRHAADLALLSAGYRLVGGVHPLPDEVRS